MGGCSTVLKYLHNPPQDGILVLWDVLDPCRYLRGHSESFPLFQIFPPQDVTSNQALIC